MDLVLHFITKCGQRGKGVKNPRNFADVLYVWSLWLHCHFFHPQIGDENVFLGDKNAACDTDLLARLKDRKSTVHFRQGKN